MPSNKNMLFNKKGSLARMTLSALLVVVLVLAACGNSDTNEINVSPVTQPPTTTQAPAPPEPPTTLPPTTQPPPASPPASPLDTAAAVERCVAETEEMVEATGETVPADQMEEAVQAWNEVCRNTVQQWLDVANAARQLGGDADCVDSVLGEVLVKPLEAFTAYAESVGDTSGDDPQWGPFGRCV